jgi:peptide chain release factor 2
MEELKTTLNQLQVQVNQAWMVLGLDQKKVHIEELEKQVVAPDFWSDSQNAQKVSKQLDGLQKAYGSWAELRAGISDTLDMLDMEEAVDILDEMTQQVQDLQAQYQAKEVELMFTNEYDMHNCVVSIHAGAGGTDAQDWAGMLMRMFSRYAQSMDFSVSIISQSDGQEAGLKSITFEVEGQHAYGYFRSEAGVHRLVRISPFDAEGMRHTSFALVEVMPVLEDVEFELNMDEVRVDTFRSGGKGGQSVNTTDSAVRMVHEPTGIKVECQNERSQLQNKETALRLLKSKLQQYYAAKAEDEKKRIKGEHTEAAWGNQIRSYVLHPYKMVKDARTAHETTEVGKVLDGDLEPFVKAYLKSSI